MAIAAEFSVTPGAGKPVTDEKLNSTGATAVVIAMVAASFRIASTIPFEQTENKCKQDTG